MIALPLRLKEAPQSERGDRRACETAGASEATNADRATTRPSIHLSTRASNTSSD